MGTSEAGQRMLEPLTDNNAFQTTIATSDEEKGDEEKGVVEDIDTNRSIINDRFTAELLQTAVGQVQEFSDSAQTNILPAVEEVYSESSVEE